MMSNEKRVTHFCEMKEEISLTYFLTLQINQHLKFIIHIASIVSYSMAFYIIKKGCKTIVYDMQLGKYFKCCTYMFQM